MKKIILTIALTFFLTAFLKAQSNLEFSRAVKEKYSFTSTAALNTTIIVPTGKVLKITSATVSPSSSNAGSSAATIDGQMVAYSTSERSSAYQYASVSFNMVLLPLWLPSGTYTVFAHGGGIFSFSGIEFNIVP